MLLPAVTGLWCPAIGDRQVAGNRVTGVATVVLLFAAVGSLPVVVTVEFAVMVPAGTVVGTFTTTRCRPRRQNCQIRRRAIHVSAGTHGRVGYRSSLQTLTQIRT